MTINRLVRGWLAAAITAGLAGAAGFEGDCDAAAKEDIMSVQKAPFGKTAGGTQVDQYTLVNSHGVTVRVITYGGIVTSVQTPDRESRPGEVTLGFDTLEGYLAGHPYF